MSPFLFVLFINLPFFCDLPRTGKSRLYPTYSISSSEAEESPVHRALYNLPYNTPAHQQQQQHQQTHQYPITYKPTAGLSDTPSSDNASDATLTDTEVAATINSTTKSKINATTATTKSGSNKNHSTKTG